VVISIKRALTKTYSTECWCEQQTTYEVKMDGGKVYVNYKTDLTTWCHTALHPHGQQLLCSYVFLPLRIRL